MGISSSASHFFFFLDLHYSLLIPRSLCTHSSTVFSGIHSFIDSFHSLLLLEHWVVGATLSSPSHSRPFVCLHSLSLQCVSKYLIRRIWSYCFPDFSSGLLSPPLIAQSIANRSLYYYSTVIAFERIQPEDQSPYLRDFCQHGLLSRSLNRVHPYHCWFIPIANGSSNPKTSRSPTKGLWLWCRHRSNFEAGCYSYSHYWSLI